MLIWLKKYWVEILIFGALFSLIVWDVSPSLTYCMVAADGTTYTMSAQYLYPAHHTSAPLYLLIGWLFIHGIPIGAEYWRMALLSAVCALGCLIFVYLIVRHHLSQKPRNRLYAIISVLVLGSSMLLISQSVIVETYTMVSMFALAAYYFVLKKKYYWVSAMLGAGLVVHHLIGIAWIVFYIFYKEMRPHISFKKQFPFVNLGNLIPLIITLSFLIFYIYIPLSKAFTDQPNMWLNTTTDGFFRNLYNTARGLIGGISIWDIPKRILDTLGILGISLMVTVIPLVWLIWKRKYWKTALFWLFILPIIYYATNLDNHVAKYMLAGLGFGAVLVGIALSMLNWKWVGAVGLCALVMLGININYFDIGRKCDANLTATKFYYEEYYKVPDGGIFLNFLAGGQWQMTFYYNKHENRHIIPVCIGMLRSPVYQEQLRTQGVKLEVSNNENITDAAMEIALSIIRLNDNVWISKETTPEDYGAIIVPAKENEQEITRWMGHQVEPEWKWKPSNPYDIVIGSIEQTWYWTLQSTYNFQYFGGIAIGMGFAYWLVFVRPNRKEHKDDSG